MGKLMNSWMCLVPKEPTFSHFSHDHPLALTSLNEEGRNEVCSGCNIHIAKGREYYTCKTCNNYSLHRKCYNLPRKFRHFADPAHELNLIYLPSFKCKACGLQGSGFSYNCSECLVHYHSRCSQMPLTLTYSSHPHPLELQSGNLVAFRCFECGNRSFNHWFYRCSVCEFDVHLSCITPPPRAPNYQTRDNSSSPPAVLVPTMPQHESPPALVAPTMPPNASSSSSQWNSSTSNNVGPNSVMQPNTLPNGACGAQRAHHRSHGIKGRMVEGVATGFSEGVGQQGAKSFFWVAWNKMTIC